MSLVHTLIDSALAANLTQNELKIFLVLLRQTLCFGKHSDPLTTKRITQLAHIRKDRVPTAIKGFLKTGLFETRPHQHYETEYYIHQQLLTQHQGQLLAPNLPKNRKQTQPPEPQPEKRVHTTNTNTIKNPDTTTARSSHEKISMDNTALPYPKTFSPTEQHQAAQILDGLSPKLASDCLQVLQQALNTSNIQKPLAYLYQLTKAARNGTLDRSTLLNTSNQTTDRKEQKSTTHSTRLQVLASEIYGLDQLFKRAGIAMDTFTAQRRKVLIDEYERLKTESASLPPNPPQPDGLSPQLPVIHD